MKEKLSTRIFIKVSLLLAVVVSGCANPDKDLVIPTMNTLSTETIILDVDPGATWFWQLSGTLDETKNATIYDIDLFETDTSTISRLKEGGKKVICYFTAGTWEFDRSSRTGTNVTQPNVEAFGETMDDWSSENWLDIRHPSVRTMVTDLLDLAVEKGCFGVEPDNVDGYHETNNTGFSLTKDDQIDFNRFIATEAHNRNLSVGLKNCSELVVDLVDDFNWALTEECDEYNECSEFQPFIDKNKAVFQAEYKTSFPQQACDAAKEMNFSMANFTFDLDGTMEACE